MGDFYYDSEIEHITQIIKNRLFFAVIYDDAKKILKNTSNVLYFSTDDELIYLNYYFDFGPLNLSCLYKFCCKLNNYLQCTTTNKKIVYFTRNNECTRVNSAYLIGSFAIMYLHLEPRQVYRMLLNAGGPYRTFVDASQGISQYTIRLLDCLFAIEKAYNYNFINFDDFNVAEYDTYDKIQNGDMNWLLPRKFLAFIGPTDNEIMNSHSPLFYLKYFLKNDIRTVIRLNNKLYDASTFRNAGIEHYDLIFPDGTTPPKSILMSFLEISEHTPHALAVHCKAGLGRTGSLIGAYIIKHYRMTAREVISWMRICRPGSVIGQQQGWLERIEPWLWKQGSCYRMEHFGEGDKIPAHKYGIYSAMWPLERKKLLLKRKDEENRKSRSASQTRPPQAPKVHLYSADGKRRNPLELRALQREKDLSQTKKLPNVAQDSQETYNKYLEELRRIYHLNEVNPNQYKYLYGDYGNNSFAQGVNVKRSYDVNRNIARAPRSVHKTSLQIAGEASKRKSIESSPYETTQGDKLNEIKVRKQMGPMAPILEPREKLRKTQQEGDDRIYTTKNINQLNRRLGDDSGNDLAKKQILLGNNLAKMKERHIDHIRDIIISQYSRKKALDTLSPFKSPAIENLYKRR